MSRRLPPLGPRGEGWVVAQSLIGVAIVVCGFVGARWPASVRAVLAVVGVVTVGLFAARPADVVILGGPDGVRKF